MATALGKKAAVKDAKTYDFTWEATAPGGGEKKKGEMNAVSANAVRASLRRMGMMPTVVRKAPQPLFGERGVKEAQVVVMVRQLS
ncbi:MAG: type II secretion system F family protein, partial [Planctomycetia bacterium]|nr:type II secretion system F family protein [Planctomycetia bacterium]